MEVAFQPDVDQERGVYVLIQSWIFEYYTTSLKSLDLTNQNYAPYQAQNFRGWSQLEFNQLSLEIIWVLQLKSDHILFLNTKMLVRKFNDPTIYYV